MGYEANSPASEIDLMAHWSEERCPIIDGIIFGDGRIKLVSANWQKQKEGTKPIPQYVSATDGGRSEPAHCYSPGCRG